MKWSVIDRWGTHPVFIDAYVDLIGRELQSINPDIRDEVIILFSAHSLPMEVNIFQYFVCTFTAGLLLVFFLFKDSQQRRSLSR